MLGVPRTQVMRMEECGWQELRISELNLAARVLGMSLEELILENKKNGLEKPSAKCSWEKPFSSMSLADGVRFDATVPNPEKCFTGQLHLAPQKSLELAEIVKAEFFYLEVREGEVLLTHGFRELILRRGDCLSLQNEIPRSIYNPHQFLKSVCGLVTLPSFMRLGN